MRTRVSTRGVHLLQRVTALQRCTMTDIGRVHSVLCRHGTCMYIVLYEGWFFKKNMLTPFFGGKISKIWISFQSPIYQKSHVSITFFPSTLKCVPCSYTNFVFLNRNINFSRRYFVKKKHSERKFQETAAILQKYEFIWWKYENLWKTMIML